MTTDKHERDYAIDKFSGYLEELQNSINSCILMAGRADEFYPDLKLRDRLNDLRGDLYRIENDYETATGERLNYCVGWATRKEWEII